MKSRTASCLSLGLVIGAVVLLLAPSGTNASGGSPKTTAAAVALPSQQDEGYAQLFADYPQYQAEITALEQAVEEDEEGRAHLLAYNDSLEAHAELARQEEALEKAIAEDPELAAAQTHFEDLAAADHEAPDRLAAFDSLLAANPELCKSLQDAEAAAAKDDSLLVKHAAAMSALEADPGLAATYYAVETGPTYAGSDPALIAYTHYLALHPAVYRPWWRVHHYLRVHPLVADGVYQHWNWFHPRTSLWRSWWDYRLQVARHRELHGIFWAQHLYLGRRPWLARALWQDRLFVCARPAFRAHAHFLRHHPVIAKGVVQHHRWAMHHPAPAHKARYALAPRPARHGKR
jgi:hypothetical protein